MYLCNPGNHESLRWVEHVLANILLKDTTRLCECRNFQYASPARSSLPVMPFSIYLLYIFLSPIAYIRLCLKSFVVDEYIPRPGCRLYGETITCTCLEELCNGRNWMHYTNVPELAAGQVPKGVEHDVVQRSKVERSADEEDEEFDDRFERDAKDVEKVSDIQSSLIQRIIWKLPDWEQ